jgi:peptidoglycan hydrolase CwlO-like protein
MTGIASGSDLGLLSVVAENTELRLLLAEAQDQCVELAVDAGDLQAEIEALRAQLAEVTDQRDAWQAEAERLSVWAVMRG